MSIEQKYSSVSTKVHSIDFSKDDEAAYLGFAAALNGLDIGVLGVSSRHATFYERVLSNPST